MSAKCQWRNMRGHSLRKGRVTTKETVLIVTQIGRLIVLWDEKNESEPVWHCDT